MTEIATDVGQVGGALGHAHSQVGEISGRVRDSESAASDPRVAMVLEQLSSQTASTVAKSGEDVDTGQAASDALGEIDESAGGGIAGVGGPVGATGSGTASGSPAAAPAAAAAPPLSAAQIEASNQVTAQQAQQQAQMMAQAQQAQAMQQAQAVQQAQMAAQMAMAGGGYEPGTIVVDQTQLAALIDAYSSGDDGGLPGTSSSRTSWDGSTSPDPIGEGDVVFDRGPDRQMSEAEKSQAIDSAMDKTGIEDPQARAKWKTVLMYMSEKESTDNPNAVNKWDSNAVGPTQSDGAPYKSSRGPWQTIPPTFAAYHAAGTSNNIYDPEASAGVAINWMKSRYDIGADGSGLEEFYAARSTNGYVGY